MQHEWLVLMCSLPLCQMPLSLLEPAQDILSQQSRLLLWFTSKRECNNHLASEGLNPGGLNAIKGSATLAP